MNDRRDQLYDNLINSGKVSEAEIGNRDEFKAAISDEAKTRQFYKNIIGSKLLTEDEIGSEDDFFGSISDDFATPQQQTPASGGGYRPSAEDMKGFLGTIGGARQAVGRSQQAVNRIGNMQQRAGLDLPKDGRIELGQNRKVTKGRERLNLETGKMESTFVTEAGNEYENRELADIEQNASDLNQYLESVPGQLDQAYKERDRLNQMAEARRKQIEDEKSNEGFVSRLLREAGRAAQSDKIPDNTSPSRDWENDREYSDIMAAIRKNNELITTLEDQRDNATNGFWHSFGTEIANGYTFSLGGKARMDDAIALGDAQKHIDSINKKRSNGEELTHEEEVAEAVLKNAAWDQEVQAKYGDDYGAWARAGKMGANSADFMLDFLMMGGMPAGMAKNILGAVVKGGERYLGNLATKGFGKFMLKATGATLGSMVAGAEITNTIQLGKTASDVAQSMEGDVYRDENGNYVFGHYEEDENGEPKFVKGGNDFFEALAQAQRSGISENGSEILGTFLPGGNRIIEALGLSKISRGLTALKGKGWYQNYSKFLKTAGFNGVVGEGLEEYGGTAIDALLGGDEWKNLADPRTHIDIWLGVTTMSGILNAPNLIGTGYSAIQYQRYKKAKNNADAVASTTMNPDTWSSLRETIDNTDNANMADVAMSILNNDDLSDEGKRAAMNYIGSLQEMRGYSLGSIAAGKEGGESESSREVDEAYTEGYDTREPDLLKQFRDEARQSADNLQQYGEEFAKMVTESQDPVATMTDIMEKRDIYSDAQIAAAADYFQKMSRVSGAMDGALDRIDTEIERLKAETRADTHQQTGNVVMAKGADNTDYYIIGGDIVTDPDTGLTSLAGTGGAVVVKDSITGEISVKSPQEVIVYSMMPAEEIMNYYDTEVRNSLMQQADDDITFGSPANEVYQLEDTVTLNDGEGNVIEGQIGMMPSAIDGVYVVYTPDNKALQFTADQLNRMIVAHNGQEVQRGSTSQPLQDESKIAETSIGISSPESNISIQENENVTQQPQTGPAQSGTNQAGGETPTSEEGGESNQPASALSRIPILTDDKGQPVLKKGRPQYQWHKASVDDAAAALVETTGGDMVMARDTASDLVKNAQAGLEKIRRQKPKGDDPIEIAESRMEIKRQEQEQQAIIKQWQDVNQAIQKQMRDEAAAHQAEIEAAKSEEQKAREAEEARQREERQREADRQRLREAIERDREKRNKEYDPLVKAREEVGDDPDAQAILSDTEPRSLEEWVSSMIRPHSMLWQDASDSEIGLQSELGLKRGDMQRMMSLLGTKESGAKPFGRVVLDIYEGLPEAMKDMYTDEDVRRTLLDLFNEGSSTRMMHLTEEHRIDEARQTARENRRREAEAEMEAWAEAYHLTPEERETFEDWRQLPPTEPEQEIINQIIADNEQNQASPEMGGRPVGGRTAAGIEGGEGQVRQTAEAAGDGNTGQEAGSGAEAGTDQPASADDNVPGAESIFVTPVLDIELSRKLVSDLSDAYASGNQADIQKAVAAMRTYVDRGGDFENKEGDSIYDYDGNDPQKLALQYKSHLLLDTYLDDDEDQEYIKTGLKASMRHHGNAVFSALSENVSPAEIKQAMDSNLVKSWLKAKGTDQAFNLFGIGSDIINMMARARLGITNKYHIGSMFNNAAEIVEAHLEEAGKRGLDDTIAKKYDFHDGDVMRELIKNGTPLFTEEELVEIAKYIKPAGMNQLKEALQAFEEEKLIRDEIERLKTYDNGDAVTKALVLYDIAIRRLREQHDGDDRFYRARTTVISDDPSRNNKDITKNPDFKLREGETVKTDYSLKSEVSRQIAEKIATSPVSVSGQSQLGQPIGKTSSPAEIKAEEAKVDINPTEAQKEAGNYQKGHIKIDGLDITIENPKGSVRRGTDADGNAWETTMHNTYGYIRGTEATDGDHLDVFLSDDPASGGIFVVDQVDPKTGKFDEVKIMIGFTDAAEAMKAYLSNYEKGWKGLGAVTGVSREVFKEWVESSHRKTKPFREYAIAKSKGIVDDHKADGEVQSPDNQETALRDAVVDHLRSIGVDVSTDWQEGQRILDEYNGNGAIKKMGTTTNNRMSDVASQFADKQLTDQQSVIASVYTGDKDNQTATFKREDGSVVRMKFQQGEDTKAGTKHSLFAHYGTTKGVISADDILRIPDVVEKGNRKQKGKNVEYTLKAGKTTYTVYAKTKGGIEVFQDFYSSWKIKNKETSTSKPSITQDENTRSAQSDDANVSSGAKVQQNSETAKDSGRKFFKTPDGHAYGYTYKGKLYIDPRIATAETPVHEYGHLWCEMKRNTAPEEWNQMKQVMLGDELVQPIIERVRRDYPKLTREGKEDDFIEEVITQFSGKRGAERLKEIADEVAAERGGIFGKAEAVTAMQRLKNILNSFWEGVAKMMGWKYRNASQIADRMMADMLNGVTMFQKRPASEPFKLSSEHKDAEGNSFYERKGTVDLWSISPLFAKARRQDAPIRLTDRNASHIMESHGNVFKTEQDVFDFLDGVFVNATKLRRGRGRGMFVVVENDRTDQAAIIKLIPSDTGDYYNVETAGYYRKSKWKDSEEVIADLSEPGQSDAAADASKPQIPDENGGEPINAEAQVSSSAGKDTKNTDTIQENQEENTPEAPKFQKTGTPGPESERPGYQNGEDALHYAERLAEYERQRRMGSPEEEPVNMAQQIYEDAIRDTGERMMIPSMLSSIFNKETRERFKHKFAESWFDYSRSIKALQDAIEKATGKTIQGFEEVWRTLNAKSSIDNDQIQKVMHNLIEPLSEFVGNMVKGKEIDGHRMTIDDVEKYMNAVHGIERNFGMAMKQAKDEYEEDTALLRQQLESGELSGKERKSVEDALLIKEARYNGIKDYMGNEVVSKWYNQWKRGLENAKRNGTITEDEYAKAKEKMEAEYEQGWKYKYRTKDYSGLTALFADEFKDEDGKPTEDMLEQAAKDYAEKFEKIVGKKSADGLWQRVKALNEWSLRKSYESGLISKDQYNDTLSMYKHYVPLRGWHDDYAGDVYQYISRGEPAEVLQGVLKKAYGRKSRAARILGTMAAMANTAIVQGNKNLVAQHLLNMAMNHKDAGLLMPSEQYYQKNADGQMIPQMPALRDDMTPDEMRQELERFEAEMKAREKAGEVQTLRSKFKKEFPLHMAKWQEQRHAVRVMRNGKEYMVYVLGDPRAAEAFNGLLNPNSQPGAISNIVNMWNRWLAKWQTSLSPEFLFSNFQRDVMTATTGAYIKFGNDYKRQFEKNILSVMPLTKATLKKLKGEEARNLGGIFSLFRKYDSGTLDMNDETERMFKEFIEGGGMTGISHITKAEEYQESMEKMVRRMRQGKMDNVRKGWKAIGDGIEFLNKGIENATRFATYMTSRQHGRSIRESIFDAKEASVNFNMKGSGAWGNMMARRLYLYVNPAMQALRMLGTWYENDPVVATKEGGKMAAKAVGKRFLKTAAGVVTASVTCAIVNKLLSELLHGDDGDDDDKDKGDWWALSEWNRYNYINVINPFGKGYFHWSIPQELRQLWAIGQIAVDMAFGRKTWQRGLQSMVLQLNNLSPLSFFEGGTDGGETVIESELRTMTPSFLAPFFDAYFWNRDFMGHKITNRHSFNEDDPEWQRAGDDTPKVVVNASRKLNNITGGADNSRGWLEDNILGGTTNPSALYYLATQQFGGVGSMAKRLFNLIDQATDDEKEVELRNIPFVPKVYVSTGDDHSKQRVLNDKFWMYYNEYKGADHELSKNRKDVEAKEMTQEYADKRIEERKADGTYNTWKIFEDNDFDYLFDKLRGSKQEDDVKRMVVDAIENDKMPDYEAMLSDPNRNADNDGLFYKVRMRQIEHKVDDMKPEEAFAEFDKTEDPRVRKELAKRISKDAGASEDPYGDKPQSDHAYQYQLQRTGEDVWEDAVLLAYQEKLRDEGREDEKKTLSGERTKVHYPGGTSDPMFKLRGGDGDKAVMRLIRENRKKLLEKYGLDTRKMPDPPKAGAESGQ